MLPGGPLDTIIDIELQPTLNPLKSQSTHSTDGSIGNKAFKVITWNLWCIMFAPRTLSNPRTCGTYVRAIAEQEDWSSFDGLIVCGFQELWSWRSGLFPTFLLPLIAFFEYIPYLGTLISWIFQFVCMLLGTIPPFRCLPLFYNPKRQVSSILRPFLNHSYYSLSIPQRCFLDNGLLLCSNREAQRSGSVGFTKPVQCTEDSMAYKGFQWAYFQRDHCLVINTHLQAAGDGEERMNQIEQINHFVADFETVIAKDFECERTLKIIACGDWNIDMTNHDKLVELKMDGRGSVSRQVSIDLDNADHLEESVQSTALDTPHEHGPVPSHGVAVEIKCDDDMDEQDGLQEDDQIVDTLRKHKKRVSLSAIRKSISAIPSIKPKIFKSRSYANIPKLLGEKWVKCNDCEPTAVDKSWGCLDHILVNFEVNQSTFKHQTLGTEGGMSDHLLIKNEFTACH